MKGLLSFDPQTNLSMPLRLRCLVLWNIAHNEFKCISHFGQPFTAEADLKPISRQFFFLSEAAQGK